MLLKRSLGCNFDDKIYFSKEAMHENMQIGFLKT